MTMIIIILIIIIVIMIIIIIMIIIMIIVLLVVIIMMINPHTDNSGCRADDVLIGLFRCPLFRVPDLFYYYYSYF